MKKLMAALLVLTLMLTSVCAFAAEPVSGGWSPRLKLSEIKNDKAAQAALKVAQEHFDGVKLKALGVLGTQVVAGTNYCILCYGTTVTLEPKPGLYKVYVYEDLKGNAEIDHVDELKLKNKPTGGWKLTSAKKDLTLESAAKTALKKATAKLVGASYKALAVLGRAKNSDGFALLCKKTLSDAAATTGLVVVTLRKSGDAWKVKSVTDVDF